MKLAYLFPGQGSQVVGMGADLYAHVHEAAVAIDEADRMMSYKISTYCFYGPAEKLSETSITQPALFTVCVAALRAFEARGFHAEAAAGHSVGEYAALVAGGALDAQTGLNLVIQRGELMRQAAMLSPGAMAAILGLASSDVIAVCAAAEAETGEVVNAANFNGAGQVVISGETNGIARAIEIAKERGAKRAIPLAVSGAFHSRLMTPAVTTMRGLLDQAIVVAPHLPVISNVTANYVAGPEEIRDNLAKQLAAPVRWEETINRLLTDGFDTFVELGSGKVLTGLVSRMAPLATAVAVNDSASLDSAVATLAKR